MDYSEFIGSSFNRLTIINVISGNKVTALCSCGNTKVLNVCHIRTGRVKSCGCLQRDNLSKRLTTHNLSNHPLYTVWINMKSRCYKENNDRYKRYGGRGITVCDSWFDFHNFYSWAIANGWELGLTIERKELNNNYTPDNCTWIKKEVQQKNTSRSRLITFDNRTMTITDWAQTLGIKTQTLFARINNYGWSIEKSFTT